VPKEYGGDGADPLTIILAMEALGYGCKDNGLIFSINAHMWSCEIPIVKFGTEAQKRRYLPGLCDGSWIGVQGMTEPGSGSDAFGLTTSAEKRGDRYILKGRRLHHQRADCGPLRGLRSHSPAGRFAGSRRFSSTERLRAWSSADRFTRWACGHRR
jgi:hypothetical protein